MSTITEVGFWRDPGFMDGGIEVPRINASIRSPSLTISENLNPSKDRMFSELRIPRDYETLWDMCYLRAVYSMNNGSDLTVYGWIDSVECQSDTDGYPITIVNWHIDYWRTFIGSADFGSGMVKRRPVTREIPPQSYPHRFVQSNGVRTRICQGPNNIWWVYICYQDTSGNGITSLRWACFPVSISYVNQNFFIRHENTDTTGKCVNLDSLLGGTADEALGIDPDAICYIGMAPVSPVEFTGYGLTETTPIVLNSSFSVYSPGESEYVMFHFSLDDIEYSDYREVGPYTSGDTEYYQIMDFEGNPVLTIPWGFTVNYYRTRIIPTTTSLTLAIYFDDTQLSGSTVMLTQAIEGMVAYIPCPSLDLNTNAWSSYVYSGAREVASRQLQLNAQSNLVSGLTGAGTSAIGGGMMGAMAGGGAVGAGIGAAAGAITSLVGSAVNYVYQSGAYADQMMDISDYEAAHQTSNLLLSGMGANNINNEVIWPSIVGITFDDYSLNVRADDLEIYGCKVSEPTADCSGLINLAGPLQIENLMVYGDIPAAAKAYIKQRFANGVRMI